MSDSFGLSDRIILSMIERHKLARAYKLAVIGARRGSWSQLRYPMLIFRRWREQMALSRLVRAVPATAEGAHRKLLYLMATLIEDGAPANLEEIRTLVATLRPHQDSLAVLLGND